MSVLGIGLDLVDIERFARVLDRRPGIADRLFTSGETDVTHGSPARIAQRLAARFAAKEAAMKSLGAGFGAMGFTDVEVVSLETGAPRIEMRRRAQEVAVSRGVTSWLVTLTHTATTAAACVVALGDR
ncbi:MAG: holo-ACP synthase [Actinomycetota bacterium]|nr:holo-ACP synthase [Actinomycetota bacterium]